MGLVMASKAPEASSLRQARKCGLRDRYVEITAALIAVIGALSFSQPYIDGSDLFWHLASGRQTIEQVAVPRVDVFSYTAAGRPWTNHEWLWGALAWLIYSVHPEAVAWANLAVIAVVFWLTWRIARNAGGSLLASGAALWLAASACHFFLDIRPHLFTLLLTCVLLATRQKRWAPWIWAPVVALWSNLHAGYIFGVGLIGLHVLWRLAARRQRWLEPASEDVPPLCGREWLLISLCLPAMLANPWAGHVLQFTADYMPLTSRSPYPQNLAEWQPISWSLDDVRTLGFFSWFSTTYGGRFLALVALAFGGALLRGRHLLYLCALSLVTAIMAQGACRFIPLFSLVAAPLVAVGFTYCFELLRRLLPRSDARGWTYGTLALGAICAVLLWSDVRLTPRLLDRWTAADTQPRAAVRYLEAIGSPRRVLNHYIWGGYLTLHARRSRVFIDGRASTVYDDALYRDFLELERGGPDTAKVLARRGADVALAPMEAMAAKLLSLEKPWRILYQDSVALILAPPGSPLWLRKLPDPRLVVGDDPQYLLWEALDELKQRHPDASQRLIELALQRDPLFIQAYGDLAMLKASRGDTVGAIRVLDRGIYYEPRGAPLFHLQAARIFEGLGDKRNMLYHLLAVYPRSPFDQPANTGQVIRRLRGEL